MIKHNKKRAATTLRILLLLLAFKITMVQAQESIIKPQVVKTQADKDWDVLQQTMYSLGTEYQKAVDLGYIEMRKYEDKIYKNRSRLAKAFWDNYPEDERRDKALYLFFNAYAEPHFLPDIVSDSILALIENTSRGRGYKTRLKPVDYSSMKLWRETGDAMVESILNSNASIERKELASLQLISRELRYAIKLGNALPKNKIEAEYWNNLEIHHYKHICLLLEDHINKYADLEQAAHHIKSILNLLKNFSPSASASYWKYFYRVTGNDHPKSNQLGIKVLHEIAKENVGAIELLKKIDYTKPLEMEFIAMDGSKINLVNMRGKVILIDFWATNCAPCIKEMPHVRAMYDKYRDVGFEVIGIAADSDDAKERVENILKKTNVNWPQRLDGGTDALVSYHALYKINVLPTVWLLNKDGIIVDRNARGERLEMLILKYLDLEK
ncbi:TlpA family protein disulfide reductase [Flavivirga algicola]|uniref:TlpA family protein disulfide reductase n=1 Tax=Flavivirga algicola TaxID=2729136 RepID=A0ABX1S3Q6_9FLAO|nr:TlpA disulfide reductase family protein [Flavivirga algicola]NMH89698.1 TlpA family protein disulfide reductase [Flavivirga algicola]